MTVAHIITDLDVGGAERMLERLLPRLARTGVHNVVICLRTPGPIGPRIEQAGTRVLSLHVSPALPNPLGALRLRQLLKDIRPDVVQTWLYHSDLAGLLGGFLAGVPKIVWNIRCAELNPRDHPRSLLMLLRVLALSSGLPAAVISNSESGRQAHERLGYAPRRWEIIPNGFDTDTFKPSADARRQLRSRLMLSEEAIIIGLLARYHPMKDHETFLKAASVALRERPDVQVVAAGRGVAGNAALTALVRELGIESRVHLLDEWSDAPSFLAALDVAVSSSYSEAFPNVVAEAMACGTPCVVTDVGESAVIVGDTGVVVPPSDPDALAEGMSTCLRMTPSDRAALGAAARARIVENYSIDAAALQYRRLYDEVTSA